MKKTIKRILMVGLSCSLLMGCAACGQGNGTDKGLMWDRTFTEEEFASPDYEYRPMPILNQNISDYLIDMAEQYGYGGVVTNVSFGDQNYLQNEEAVELFVDAVEYAINDLAIRVWIYDENGYPSGTCGGKVTRENPEYAAQGLVVRTYACQSGERAEIEIPYGHTLLSATAYKSSDIADGNFTAGKDISGYASDGVISWTSDLNAETMIILQLTKSYYEGTHGTANWYAKRKILDMLNPDATQSFIRSTYERYYELVGEYFGKGIEAFFTDEPALAGLYLDPPSFSVTVEDEPDENIPLYPTANWTEDFASVFAENRGYEIGDRMLYLFQGDSDEAKRFRWDYYQTITEMKSSSYEGQIADWCEEHDVAFSGHFFDEEYLYDHPYYNGNLMRSLSEQTIPGIDFLSNNMGVAVGWAATTGKFASSAAHFKGQNTVFCEISNDYDSVKADVYGKINTAGLLYAVGVNEFGSYFRLVGGSKMEEEDHILFANTLGRMGYLMKGSVQDSDVALYYPAEGLFAEAVIPSDGKKTSINSEATGISDNFTNIAKSMLTNQIGYEIFDSVNLLACETDGAELVTPSGMRFSTVVIPQTHALDAQVAEKLLAFAKAGGTVILQGDSSYLANKESEQAGLDEAMRELKTLSSCIVTDSSSAVANAILERGVQGVRLSTENANIVAGKFVNGSSTVVFPFVNTSGKTVSVVAELDEVGTEYKQWNPYTGSVSDISVNTSENSSQVMVSIPANRTVFITVS